MALWRDLPLAVPALTIDELASIYNHACQSSRDGNGLYNSLISDRAVKMPLSLPPLQVTALKMSVYPVIMLVVCRQ